MTLVTGMIAMLALGFIIWATIRSPRLTNVLFWSLLATIGSSSAILLIAPGSFSEKALWVALSVPLIWVALQFWCYWDQQPHRVTAGLITTTLISAAIISITEPVI